MSLSLPPLPDGWSWATVADVGATSDQAVLTGPFGTSLGPDDFVPETASAVPVLTIGCLREAGIDLRKASFVTPAKATELERYRLRAGDILFSRMATVGRAGLVKAAQEAALFNYHIMRLRLRDDAIDPPPWGTWTTFYAAVLLFLGFLIALFTWFTRAFSA